MVSITFLTFTGLHSPGRRWKRQKPSGLKRAAAWQLALPVRTKHARKGVNEDIKVDRGEGDRRERLGSMCGVRKKCLRSRTRTIAATGVEGQPEWRGSSESRISSQPFRAGTISLESNP